MNKRWLMFIALAVLALAIAGTSPVQATSPYLRQEATAVVAYIDPTAGGAIIQLLLASAAGILGVIGLFWKRILRRIRPPKEGQEPPATKDKERQ